MAHLSNGPNLRGGYAVRAPRPGDAIGVSLRNVFGIDPELPTSFNALLIRLDTIQPC